MADDRGRGVGNGAIIVLVVAAVALLAFVVQNTEDVRFNWLMIELTMPLWLALVIAAVLGAIIANLGGWLLRRRG